MSLRKSPTLTPALFAANRRNAQKSTGPRTEGGKARSRWNGLRKGTRSPFCRNLLHALFYTPPCGVEQTARLLLSREATSHPRIATTVEMFGQEGAEVVRQSRIIEAIMAARVMKEIDVQSRKVIENKRGQNREPDNSPDLIENSIVIRIFLYLIENIDVKIASAPHPRHNRRQNGPFCIKLPPTRDLIENKGDNDGDPSNER